MGKIKSKMIKRSGKTLLEKDNGFTENFEENKKILGNTLPSKKLRNNLAGFLTRLKKQQNKEKEKLAVK